MKKDFFIYLGKIIVISALLSGLLHIIGLEIDANIFILVVTAITVFWYAFETQGMRKEMIDQTNISIMPIFYISEIIETGGSRHVLLLENCGNFPAFNVKIEDIKIKAKLKSTVTVLKFVFHEFEVVPKGEKIPIVFDIFKDAKRVDDEGKEILEPHLFEGFAEYDFDVPMTYENILAHRYRVILKMGKGGSRTEKPERIN